MLVFHGIEAFPAPYAASTIAIGTFDGIHAGHQVIICAAIDDARKYKRPSIVFTFDRHPAEVLRPDRVPDYLSTPGQRIRLIEALAPDLLLIARFDTALSHMGRRRFVDEILNQLLGGRCIVAGVDFRFGENREGDVDYLKSVGAEFDFGVASIDPVTVDGIPASSTRIRKLIQSGRIVEAERALGHPYMLAGHVVQGRQLGRALGYPTANLDRDFRQVVPLDGIYAVKVLLNDGRVVGGACSIGSRPTIEGNGARTIETYLFDFDEDLYGQAMQLQFVKYLRPELKFESLSELKEQIGLDCREARDVLDR